MKLPTTLSLFTALSLVSAAAIDPAISSAGAVSPVPTGVPPPPKTSFSACTTSHNPPLTSDCLKAVSQLSTITPAACTLIYKPWHIAASHGTCTIGYWAPGNAHCLPGREMKMLAQRVVGECSSPGKKGRPGKGRVTEGYRATKESDGKVGVWVYRTGTEPDGQGIIVDAPIVVEDEGDVEDDGVVEETAGATA